MVFTIRFNFCVRSEDKNRVLLVASMNFKMEWGRFTFQADLAYNWDVIDQFKLFVTTSLEIFMEASIINKAAG